MVMYRLLFTRRQRCSEWKHLLSAIWLRNAAFHSAMSCCLWRTKKNLVTLDGLKMELVPCWNTHICVTCPSSHGKNMMWSSEELAHTTHQRWRGVRGRMDQNHPIWHYWAYLVLLPQALLWSTAGSCIPSSIAAKTYEVPFTLSRIPECPSASLMMRTEQNPQTSVGRNAPGGAFKSKQNMHPFRKRSHGFGGDLAG